MPGIVKRVKRPPEEAVLLRVAAGTAFRWPASSVTRSFVGEDATEVEDPEVPEVPLADSSLRGGEKPVEVKDAIVKR